MRNMMQKRTIGVLSKETGVKVTTIRYYESIGLMNTPARTESGQRIYDTDSTNRLNFIRHARELGFSVESISELIELQTQPGDNCAVADEIARRHLADVRQRLTRLEALEVELKRMITSCEGGTIDSCEIMACLSDHEQCLTEHEKESVVQNSGRA